MNIFFRRLSVALTLALTLGSAFAADTKLDKNIDAKIGNVSIAIPVPQAYVDSSLMFPKVLQLGETMTASANRLLAFFISDDDVKALLSQTAPTLQRYMMVQTLRAAEDSSMGAQDFKEVRNQLKNQYKQFIADSKERMQSEVDQAVERLSKESSQPKNVSMKLGELKVIEVMEDEKFVTLITKTLVGANVNGELKEIPMVMGLGTTMVKGKIVYFFCYARLNSDADVAWIKSQNAMWMPSLFAANSTQ
ncbi:hypothetical protein [Undibacterium sp. Ji22W]|uniref:hypothetical protein n=1 Tax=Undibacterium sp. Ji22W TaxID=3413038 RepID=UPI003BF3568B